MVLVDHLLQSLAKIPHQGAADAAGVHLPDFNARLLEEAAVNADFTELILNEDQLLALKPMLLSMQIILLIFSLRFSGSC